MKEVAGNAFDGAACVTVSGNVRYADTWAVGIGPAPEYDEKGNEKEREPVVMTSCAIRSGTATKNVYIFNPEAKIEDGYSDYDVINQTNEYKKRFVIYGYKDSTAETFARKNYFSFKEIDEAQFTTTAPVTTAVTSKAAKTTTTTSAATSTASETARTTQTMLPVTTIPVTTTKDNRPRADIDPETGALVISGEGVLDKYLIDCSEKAPHVIIGDGIIRRCEQG